MMMTMKRKRTKRQRTQSPRSFALASSHLLHEEDCGGLETAKDAKMEPSPSSSSGYTHSCTEEEEDMANCLILLAHGKSVARESRMELATNNHRNVDIRTTSKRFLETSSIGDGKVGYHVYVCKTCNRTFSSFQALGGHRASHKKPKPNYIEEVKKINDNILETDTDKDERCKNNNSQFPLQLSCNSKELHGNIQHNAATNQKSKGNNKVHECGICGAEFNSGQALGGHMRRHRGAMGTTNMALSLSPMATESGKDDNKSKTSRKVLALELDLNLPAQEDDNLESRSDDFASKQHQEQPQQQQEQQQQSFVFSSPALVNCRY